MAEKTEKIGLIAAMLGLDSVTSNGNSELEIDLDHLERRNHELFGDGKNPQRYESGKKAIAQKRLKKLNLN